jgi:hypothetical protein
MEWVKSNIGVIDCEIRGWNLIGFWLNSTELENPHTRPFRNNKLQATRERYGQVWAQLILFCLRVLDGEEQLEKQLLSEDVRTKLVELRADLHLDSNNEFNTSQRILELSDLLLKQSDYDKEYSIVKYFAGIMGYSVKEGTWLRPQDYTPYLARILFCMQVIGLELSIPMLERDGMDLSTTTPEDRLNQFRTKWLIENQPTPFNYLHKLLNYGLTVAKDGVGNNWMRVSRDEQWLYYKGERLSIPDLKSFQKVLLRKAENVLSRSLLFQKSDTVPNINPYQFSMEDFSNLDVGYYFADVIPNWRHSNRATVLNNLIADVDQWNILVDGASDMSGGIKWKLQGIKRYENACKEFLEYMAVILNMQGGETGRGEEMMMMTYKNTIDQERNLKLDSGQIVLETVYHKSQHLTEKLKVHLEYHH